MIEAEIDGSAEDWSDFLAKVEERCLAQNPPRSASADNREAFWLTENGDPIDPIAFFLTFTGLE